MNSFLNPPIASSAPSVVRRDLLEHVGRRRLAGAVLGQEVDVVDLAVRAELLANAAKSSRAFGLELETRAIASVAPVDRLQSDLRGRGGGNAEGSD